VRRNWPALKKGQVAYEEAVKQTGAIVSLVIATVRGPACLSSRQRANHADAVGGRDQIS